MTELYTFSQLAKELRAEFPDSKINERMLRKFHKMGMRAVHLGRAYYVRREAFDEFIRSHESPEYKPYRKEGS